MRRTALLLCLLLPLAACASDTSSLGSQPEAECAVIPPADTAPPSTLEACEAFNSAQASPPPTGCGYYDDDPLLQTPGIDICAEIARRDQRPHSVSVSCPGGEAYVTDPAVVEGSAEYDCASFTPTPPDGEHPPAPEPSSPSPNTLESGSLLLNGAGGEITMVRGLSPQRVLQALVAGSEPGPTAQVCPADGFEDSSESCLSARAIGEWAVAVDLSGYSVGGGPEDLLARLSDDGHDVVHVAAYPDASAPFVVAQGGREVRRFDFCSEGSADEGTPLPEEEGLGLETCDGDRLDLVRRLTGITVTEELLTRQDGIAVVARS